MSRDLSIPIETHFQNHENEPIFGGLTRFAILQPISSHPSPFPYIHPNTPLKSSTKSFCPLPLPQPPPTPLSVFRARAVLHRNVNPD